ncbi:Dihydrolipoyllysine-residue acetyltransferase component of acetoin cleaving system [Podospora aff. communis PSN243]|uniref:Dihydrolipoyllysine-residue acetyltransferase component of acetoin cleaving system n=1 Tax=Podospora aff. communis PSN243 TaxID=3040156 RepID=A0AAV9GHR8_9PEZI|nr:Dihydrolipoyllysine-residue acetyltransferase component of acetoin cleaving system [Podospora aff. communis PSN243]
MPPPTETTPLTSPPQHPLPQQEPFFLSLSPHNPTTILLLHGLTSSHLEWAPILPLLTPHYHILAVDLPGHSRSATLLPPPGEPLTIPFMTDSIAGIIQSHAHKSVAHIVGMSAGGFVALELARRYPELCTSVFATGAHPFRGSYRFLASRPGIVMGIMWVMYNLPDVLYWKLVEWSGMRRHEELRGEMRGNRTWEVVSGVYGSILEFGGWEGVGGEVRTLVAVAEKGDDVGSVRGLRMGEGARVVVVKRALHAWNLQMPELFAEGIKAWVEGRGLPEGFEELEGRRVSRV